MLFKPFKAERGIGRCIMKDMYPSMYEIYDTERINGLQLHHRFGDEGSNAGTFHY